MVYLPSKDIWDRMLNTAAPGVWFDRLSDGTVALVAMLPVAAVKSIREGAKVHLVVSIPTVECHRVRCVGLEIYDDPEHPLCIIRPHRTDDEHSLLVECLQDDPIWLHLFDELSRPVLDVAFHLDAVSRLNVIKTLARTMPHFVGVRGPITELAMDICCDDLLLARSGSPTSSILCVAPLQINNKEVTRIHAIGMGSFALDDADEGGGLEQSAHQLLESLYPMNHFRSPQVEDGGRQRELTDLLTFSEHGICLVESKALSILGKALDRPTGKRVAQIRKDIKKGLSQLRGAVNKVRSGAVITDASGEEIQLPSPGDALVQAIVLVSEMHPLLDWAAIARQLAAVSTQNALFHVLDVQELRMLISASEDPAILMVNLVKRFRSVVESGNALVRARFPLREGPPA